VKQTLYDVLEVSRNASLSVIRAAYKSLVQRYHPDKNPDNPDAENQLKLINHAYETLSDPSSRLAYDALLAMEEMPAPEEEAASEEAPLPEAAARAFDKRVIYAGGAAFLVLIAGAAFFIFGKKHEVEAPVRQAAIKPLQPASVPEKPLQKPVVEAPPMPEAVEMPKMPAPVETPAPKPVVKPAPVEMRKAVAKPSPRPVLKPEPVREPAEAVAPKPVPKPVQPAPVMAPPPVLQEKYADLASAVSSGDTAAVAGMLKDGWDPNQIRGNQVPLIIAVKNDDVKMVKLLIRHGADVNLTDSQGNSAMIYAKVRADAKMIEMLKNAGAKNPFD
jgi:DnaJ-domain-containing protein 1